MSTVEPTIIIIILYEFIIIIIIIYNEKKHFREHCNLSICVLV